MPKLIKDRSIVEDSFTLLQLNADGSLPTVPATGDVIVPLAMWKAQKDALLARQGQTGVWIDSHEEVEDLGSDASKFAVVAVNFPAFTDGRGFSTGRLLRERYGYQGELRAFGDVFKDLLYFMLRCGFNAFVVRDDKDIDEALKGLNDFSDAYQVAVDQKVPLFRRRNAA